ncbi:MAG: VCBS repeat-containing protein [Pirellulales bacterium]
MSSRNHNYSCSIVSRCVNEFGWLVHLRLFVLLIVVQFSGCDTKTPAPPKVVSKSISAEHESLKNRLVALIENGAEDKEKGAALIDEAVDGFRKLSKEIPKEPLTHQNLAIALSFQIRNARLNNRDPAKLEQEFLAEIGTLKKINADSPDAWVLESRFHHDSGEMSKAESALREAINKKDASAVDYFQLFELVQSSGNPQNASPAENRKLLEVALAKSSTNLAIQVAYLNNLAVLQDEAAFAKQFEVCKQSFAPMLSRTGSQLVKLVERVQAAFEKKDWKVVQTQTIYIRNSMLAEIAYVNDLHLLRPHVLEFLKLEFNDSAARKEAVVEPASLLTDNIGINTSSVTAIATEDFDLDGRADIALSKNGGVEVWSFANKTAEKLTESPLKESVSGIVMADLDRDFQARKESLPSSALPTTAAPDASKKPEFLDTDIDLVLYGPSGLSLLENKLSDDKKSRSLVPRPLSEGMEALKGVRFVTVIDLDHDSDLDLIISSEGKGVTLWSNRGDWTFAEFTEYSTLPDKTKNYDWLLSFDADRNVLVDIFVGSDNATGPVMLGNNLHGRYYPHDLAWSKELQGACRGIDAIDVNHDACWDLLTCGEKGVCLQIMKSPGRKGWLPDSAVKLSDTASLGLQVCDLNNDGQSDCVAWGKKGAELFYGQAGGGLKRHPKAAIDTSLLQCIVIDIDSDNDEDLVALTEDGKLTLLKNQDGNKQQQLEVVLRADEDGSQRPRERCNMHGVGSLLELKSAGTYQAKIVRGTKTRFGIASNKTADLMRVIWTNGTPNNIFNVSSQATVFDQQRLNASCPFLYTWNGERFEFYTDCLWAAPIGLQFGPGVLAPCREWEYLKIDGSALKPKGDKYLLQLTEELWEAAYFDTVELVAVDHPANIQVFTNEKVGPPTIAAQKLYTVKDRKQPKVVDKAGNDLTEIASARDRRYTKSWTQGLTQGITDPHWIEVDLNVANTTSDEKVLFLTGWIFPTCTSLNLALSEDPSRPEMQPPSILVPDDQGNWVETIPFTGFPGGKTKTIAIDLKGKFLSNDHRIRLVSNMELCWDEVFFTIGEREADESQYRVQPLELQSADLHYRGFSDEELRPGNAPNYYDYNRVIKNSVWAPMQGAFTRYGDVLPLLKRSDDIQVVMGAGDEVTLGVFYT